MSDEVELGTVTIRKILREDGTAVAIRVSDGLPWWDAIAMLAAATHSIDSIYQEGQ